MEILPFPIICFNLLLSLSLPFSIFHFHPVTRAPVIFSRSFDRATMNLAARYSNGVIPRVCPLVHALVQCNPQRAHAYPDPQDKFHDRFGKRKKRGEEKEEKKKNGGRSRNGSCFARW